MRATEAYPNLFQINDMGQGLTGNLIFGVKINYWYIRLMRPFITLWTLLMRIIKIFPS